MINMGPWRCAAAKAHRLDCLAESQPPHRHHLDGDWSLPSSSSGVCKAESRVGGELRLPAHSRLEAECGHGATGAIRRVQISR
jgi:hypothetical protein